MLKIVVKNVYKMKSQILAICFVSKQIFFEVLGESLNGHHLKRNSGYHTHLMS